MLFAFVICAFLADIGHADDLSQSKNASAKLPIVFGGFIDTYYVYDFNNPANHDRSFTTQPSRHNEFNVNLTFVDAKLSTEQLRGRLALQTGTSVQSNYSSEPTLGQHIQEAVIGYRVTDKLWIDGGIYLSHIGFESWISKENWTYTRSLAADFSPYYQSGVKATYQWTDTLSTQLHVLNGWQNISEKNGNKALGLQIAYNPNPQLSFTYNNFFGNEVGSQWRFFNDLIAKVALTPTIQIAAIYDIGLQQTSGGESAAVWQTYGAFVRYQFTPRLSFTARGEQFFDRNQVIVATGTANGFLTTGTSINADVTLHEQALWRTELRGLWSKDSIYPKGLGTSTSNGFIVTSLSLWF